MIEKRTDIDAMLRACVTPKITGTTGQDWGFLTVKFFVKTFLEEEREITTVCVHGEDALVNAAENVLMNGVGNQNLLYNDNVLYIKDLRIDSGYKSEHKPVEFFK